MIMLKLARSLRFAPDDSRARALGLRGKLCIHPEQVTLVNRIFRDDLDVVETRATVAAYEQVQQDGRGAIAFKGQMIDEAVVRRARRVLSEAGDA